VYQQILVGRELCRAPDTAAEVPFLEVELAQLRDARGLASVSGRSPTTVRISDSDLT